MGTNQIWTLPADNVSGALTNTSGTLTWTTVEPPPLEINSLGREQVQLNYTGSTTQIHASRFHPARTGTYINVTFSIETSSNASGGLHAGIYEAASTNTATRYTRLAVTPNASFVNNDTFRHNLQQFVTCTFPGPGVMLRNDRSYLVVLCFQSPTASQRLVMAGDLQRFARGHSGSVWYVQGNNLSNINDIDTESRTVTDTNVGPWIRVW